MSAQTGIVNIRGKEYQTVALRVQLFREKHPEHGLSTEIVYCDAECVRMKALITDASGRVIATGHSEEYRKSSQINRTSALENAETSAIGRALAAFGMGGTEFASANEVENAIHQQGRQEGQSQGDSQGAVSPPAKRPPAHSALKTKLRAFVHDMEGCGDMDTWIALRESHKPLIAEVREKLPQWWEGGPDMPEEFVPLHRRIEILEANLEQNEPNILAAG